MIVYLAGPISGCSYKGAVDWRAAVSEELLRRGFDTRDPMRSTEFLSRRRKLTPHGYDDHPTCTSAAIFKRDTFDVNDCDIVLANLCGADRVSIGTMMEIALAWDWKKFVAVAMEPKGNIHDHAFVYQAASVILPTLEETVDYVTEVFP